jgi:hypothetical protein
MICYNCNESLDNDKFGLIQHLLICKYQFNKTKAKQVCIGIANIEIELEKLEV